jgi:hypothetical protein
VSAASNLHFHWPCHPSKATRNKIKCELCLFYVYEVAKYFSNILYNASNKAICMSRDSVHMERSDFGGSGKLAATLSACCQELRVKYTDKQIAESKAIERRYRLISIRLINFFHLDVMKPSPALILQAMVYFHQ